MKIIRRRVAYSGKYLRIVNKYFKVGGETGCWETVERTNAVSGAVVILALTPSHEIILERNWRAPIESWVIQFPAGLTDREGESEADTARRELLEETGYLAKTLIPIMVAPENPVLSPTSVSHFLAPDVVYTGKASPEKLEEIEVIRLPLSELSDFLLNPPADTTIDLRVPGLLWVVEKRGMLKL